MNPPPSSLRKGSKESLTSVKSEEPPSSPATTHISIQVTHRSSKSGRSHILPLLLLIIAAVLLLFLLKGYPLFEDTLPKIQIFTRKTDS